jgi:hypothetical protein
MIWVHVATEVVSWSTWLWQHRQAFEPVIGRVGDLGEFAGAALMNPDGALRRVGNTLVFGQADAGPRVLAFLEQTAPRVESIQQAVGTLQAGQGAISASLSSLETLSMVSLGLTAFIPVVLGAQFAALHRRLSDIQRLLARLDKKFDVAVMADLRAGLDLLRQGQDFLETNDGANAHSRLNAALPYCLRTMKYFSGLLGDELHQGKVQRAEIRLLARHLSVAVVAVASYQVGLGQDQHAFAQSGQEIDLLRQAARWTFQESVGRDPAPFLLPCMRECGVTIDFMARLFQQARDAGAVEPGTDCSVAAWFEEHREGLFQARPPRWGLARWRQTLRGQLHEAVAAVEEHNRVVGLATLVEQVRGEGNSTLDILREFNRNVGPANAARAPYVAWGLS